MEQNLKTTFSLIAKRRWLEVDEQFLTQLVQRWNSLQPIVDIINQFDTNDIEVEGHVSYMLNSSLATDQDIEFLDPITSLKTVQKKLQPNNQVRHKHEI